MRRWGKPQPRIFSHKGKAFKFYSSFGGFLRVPAAEEFTSEPYLPNRTIWFEELEAIAYTPKQVVGLICSNLCTRINAPEGIKSNEWNQRRWINYIEINRTHTSIWIVHIFKSNHITWTSSTGYMRISWTAVQITVAFQIGTSWKMVELSSMLFTCAQLLTIHHTKTWFWQKKSTTMENECFDVSTRIRWSWSYRLCLLEKQKGNREEKQKHCHSCSTVESTGREQRSAPSRPCSWWRRCEERASRHRVVKVMWRAPIVATTCQLVQRPNSFKSERPTWTLVFNFRLQV